MNATFSLDQLTTNQLRSLAAQLVQRVECLDRAVLHHKTFNQKLIHELVAPKSYRFAKRAESFSPGWASLLGSMLHRHHHIHENGETRSVCRHRVRI